MSPAVEEESNQLVALRRPKVINLLRKRYNFSVTTYSQTLTQYSTAGVPTWLSSLPDLQCG